jgi:hypothetical protein
MPDEADEASAATRADAEKQLKVRDRGDTVRCCSQLIRFIRTLSTLAG